MKIRKGKLSDLNVLMKFMNSAPELQGIEGEQTYSRDFVKACLADKQRNLALIAEDKGQIIGFVVSELWKRQRYSFLVDIFVRADYRKKGVASEMMKTYEKMCKKMRMQKIHLLALTTNKRMQGFVEKRGYKQGNKMYFYAKGLR